LQGPEDALIEATRQHAREAHGSHTGAPLPPGIPATGKSITWKECHRSVRAPVVWPTSIRWPSGSRM
jgi:hypothetical protein